MGRSIPYHPNVVRNSLGAIFDLPWAETTAAEAIQWAQQKELQILALDPRGDRLYDEVDLSRGTILVLGSEAIGLQSIWKQHAAHLLRIPVHSAAIDSLNVASTAAIVSYEALRQRKSTRSELCGSS